MPRYARPSLRDRVLTRRTAIGLALLAAAGAACSPVGSKPRSTPKAQPSSDLDPDVELALAAIETTALVSEVLERTIDRHRSLRRVLDPALETHRAHVRMLSEAAPGSTATGGSTGVRVPRDPSRALRRAAAAEAEAGTSLRQHAFAARSGQFARLLASMSAASAQLAFVLDEAVSDTPSTPPTPGKGAGR